MLKALLFIEILVIIGGSVFYLSMTVAARRELGHLPTLILGLMAAIAFLSPQLVLTHIAVGLVPLLLGRTKLQVGIVVAIGIIAVPSLNTFLIVGGLPLFPWTLQSSIAVGGLLALPLSSGKLARVPSGTDSTLLVVIAVLLVVDARGTAVTNWFRQLADYLFTFVIPVFIVTRSAVGAAERRILLTALAGAGVILSVIVLYEMRAGWPLYASLGAHYGFGGVGLIVKWRGGLMRAYGPMMEATNMAFVLVVTFAAAMASRRSFTSNTVYVAILASIAIGTFAPQSRGGLIGIAVAFVASSFYRRGARSTTQILSAGALIGGAYCASIAIDAFGGQLNNSLRDASSSSDYRTALLRRGIVEFWKSPLVGDSYEHVVARMQDLVQGEGIVDFVNSYLYFALFAGGLGLTMFCLAFLLPIGRLVRIRAQLPPDSAERDVAGFSMALLSAAAVMLAFTSYPQRPAIFLLIASALAFMTQLPRRVVGGQHLDGLIRTSGGFQAA